MSLEERSAILAAEIFAEFFMRGEFSKVLDDMEEEDLVEFENSIAEIICVAMRDIREA